MKKFLSILMVLAMLFSLCAFVGCAKEEEAPAAGTQTPAAGTQTPAAGTQAPADDGSTTEVFDIGGYVSVNVVTAADGTVTYDGLTKADLEASLPNQNVPQKLAAGMEVLIGYAHMQLTDQNNVRRNEGIQAHFEALGFTYSAEAFDFDAGRQLQLIENFLTMGAAVIFTNMLDVAASAELCERTEAEGCYFVVTGAYPEGHVSGIIYADQVAIGTAHADLILSWIDERYPDAGPGDIKACYLGNTRNADPALRTRTVEECLAADGRVDVVFSNHDTLSLEGAYSLVENAFQADPDIRVVITFNISQAIGANNYIVAMPGVNIDEYGIFTNNTEESLDALIEGAKNNDGTSAIRGTIGVDAIDAGSQEEVVAVGLLLKGECPSILQQPLWTINTFGYEL